MVRRNNKTPKRKGIKEESDKARLPDPDPLFLSDIIISHIPEVTDPNFYKQFGPNFESPKLSPKLEKIREDLLSLSPDDRLKALEELRNREDTLTGEVRQNTSSSPTVPPTKPQPA